MRKLWWLANIYWIILIMYGGGKLFTYGFDTSELGETACAYFEKIQELCDENNIQLIVFSTPFGISTTDKHYIYRQGINNTLETYLAEKNIPFLYFPTV